MHNTQTYVLVAHVAGELARMTECVDWKRGRSGSLTSLFPPLNEVHRRLAKHSVHSEWTFHMCGQIRSIKEMSELKTT